MVVTVPAVLQGTPAKVPAQPPVPEKVGLDNVKWRPMTAEQLKEKGMDDLQQLYNDHLSQVDGIQMSVAPLLPAIPSGVYYEMPVLITLCTL